MTTVGYALGRPRPAASRGGDCHVRDLGSGLRFDGPTHFAAPERCQIDNGLLRLTVGEAGAAPALTVEAYRGVVVTGDTYSDTYSDTYGTAGLSEKEWLAMGAVTIDSPAVDAVLTGVRMVHINPEMVTIQLVAPLMAHAYVTLRRGERQCRIQHGATRPPLFDLPRRIRWTAVPAPVGTASGRRVEETSPVFDGFLRFLAAITPAAVDAGAFSLTTAAVRHARSSAGVGTYAEGDTPPGMHQQLGDASRQALVVR